MGLRLSIAIHSAILRYAVLAGCVLALLWPTKAIAANVLLVTDSSTPSSQESARKTAFEGWGHTVVTIKDSDSQANFDIAMATVDVMYVPATVTDWQLLAKVKLTSKGVILEKTSLDDDMGFSTNQGWDNSYTQIEILDNSHPITSGFSTGYITVVSSSQPLALMNSTIASGMTLLARQTPGNGYMLGVIETGGTLADSSAAAGRRVRMPWGGDSFDFDNLNANGELITEQAITWAAETAPAISRNVLLVTAGSSLTSEELERKGTFEGWGHTVTTIEDGDSEANFDAAMAINDVVYVPQTADAASLGYKLRIAKIGIVHEGVTSWDDNVGWTTSTGQNTNTCTTMTVVDNTHPISEHFSTGTVTIFDSSTASYGSQVVATVASGAEVLATNRCINSGNANLLVLEIGEELANTYNDNNTALGRRVRLPYGGSYTFAASNVSDDGEAMVKAAIEWAASDGLVAHYKLDEDSGTTAFDSSDNKYDGTYSGGVTLEAAGPGVGGANLAASFDGSNDHVVLPAIDGAFSRGITIALWAKPTAVADWARFIELSNGANNDDISFARKYTSDDLRFSNEE